MSRWFAAMVVVISGSSAAASDRNGWAEIEKQALAARLDMQSGFIEAISSHWLGDAAEPIVTRFTLTFDGQQYRIDYASRPPGAASDRSGHKVVTPDRFIEHTDGVGPDGRAFAVVMARKGEGPNNAYESHRRDIFDPRCLGVVPMNSSSLYAFSVDRCLTRPDRGECSLSEVDLDGQAALLIAYQRKDDVPVRMWIIPSMNFSVVRVEEDGVAPEGRFTDRVRATMRQFDEGGVWFPSRVDYERTLDDRVVEREVLEVTSARFNNAVDPKMFGPETMNIPAGTGVLEHPPNPAGSRTWDGNELVVKKSKRAPINEPDVPVLRNRMWPVVISVNLAGIAVASMILLYRRSRDRSRSK